MIHWLNLLGYKATSNNKNSENILTRFDFVFSSTHFSFNKNIKRKCVQDNNNDHNILLFFSYKVLLYSTLYNRNKYNNNIVILNSYYIIKLIKKSNVSQVFVIFVLFWVLCRLFKWWTIYNKSLTFFSVTFFSLSDKSHFAT